MRTICFFLCLFMLAFGGEISSQTPYLGYIDNAITLVSSLENEENLAIVRLEFDNLEAQSQYKTCYRTLYSDFEYYIGVVPLGGGLKDISFNVYGSNKQLVTSSYVSNQNGTPVGVAIFTPEATQQYAIEVHTEEFASGKLSGDYMLIFAYENYTILESSHYDYLEQRRDRFRMVDTYYSPSTFKATGNTLEHEINSLKYTYEMGDSKEIPFEGENITVWSATNQYGTEFNICFHEASNSIWIFPVSGEWFKIYYLAK